MKEKVSVPFMLLGILFNVCLIAANLLETKVIQIGSLTVTAGFVYVTRKHGIIACRSFIKAKMMFLYQPM